MRIPISENQIGVITKYNSYSNLNRNQRIKVYYFIPDYIWGYDYYVKNGNRVMTFSEFKKEYPNMRYLNDCQRTK